MLVWTNFFALSLSLSLSGSSRPCFTLSFSFFVPFPSTRTTCSSFCLSLSLYIYSNPRFHLRFSLRVCSHALRRIFVSFRVPVRSPVASSFFFFSIVHSPAPLALQTLLADEARFVLNFLNFIFRGFPKFSLPVSIFIFIESLSSIYPPPLDDGSRYNLIRQ